MLSNQQRNRWGEEKGVHCHGEVRAKTERCVPRGVKSTKTFDPGYLYDTYIIRRVR